MSTDPTALGSNVDSPCRKAFLQPEKNLASLGRKAEMLHLAAMTRLRRSKFTVEEAAEFKEWPVNYHQRGAKHFKNFKKAAKARAWDPMVIKEKVAAFQAAVKDAGEGSLTEVDHVESFDVGAPLREERTRQPPLRDRSKRDAKLKAERAQIKREKKAQMEEMEEMEEESRDQ